MGVGEAFQGQTGFQVEALTLSRGGRVLVDALSFAAKAGDYLEIRGANGVGKTTLLRAIAGFLKPRGGRVVFNAGEDPALALHYLGHLNGLKPAASARAHVQYWAGLLGGDVDQASAALERVALTRAADLPARVLSQGQQRRLALARLLIAPRPIWLLDEPAAALDSDGNATLSALINAHRANGGLALAAVHGALGIEPTTTLTLGAA